MFSFHKVVTDLKAHQALPAYLGLLVPRAVPDQVVKEGKRERGEDRVFKDREASEDYLDSLENQRNTKQIILEEVS